MRIVYLNPAGALGGAERSLLDLLVSVKEAEPSAEPYLVAGTDGPLLEEAQKIGIGVNLLPMPAPLAEMGDSGLQEPGRIQALMNLARRGAAAGLAIWRYAAQLRRTVAALRPDVIHSNGIKSHLLTRLAGLQRRPVLWHIRDFVSLRPVMSHALRWGSKGVRGGIAISHAVQRDVGTIMPRLPIDVVHNAVDTDYFSPGAGDGRRLDALAGLSPGDSRTVRIGLVATFARWKGQEVFLDAAARVLRNAPPPSVRFYVIGGPIYQTHGSQFTECELRALAAERKLDGLVGFIGFQEKLAHIYRALDIVVHAGTRPEPFGRTIVEAMACGKPVIVSQAGGAVELFTSRCDAIGVPPGDAAALASAIRELAGDPDLRQRLAHYARQTAAARFSRRRLGPQLLSIYRRLLSGPRSQSQQRSSPPAPSTQTAAA